MLRKSNDHPKDWSAVELTRYLLTIYSREKVKEMTHQEMIDAVLKDEIDKE